VGGAAGLSAAAAGGCGATAGQADGRPCVAQDGGGTWLVSRPADTGAKSRQLFDDRVCGGGPLQALAVRVVSRVKVVDAQHELPDAGEPWPAAVRKWLDAQYPQIAARAKAEAAEIHRGGEIGLRSDEVRGRSDAPQGHTPVVRGNTTSATACRSSPASPTAPRCAGRSSTSRSMPAS